MKIGPKIRKRTKMADDLAKRGGFQDTPMLVASLKRLLALVYPDTLMLTPHFPPSPTNTPIFGKKKKKK